MNYTRWISTFSMVLGLMLVLTKYTNCAPPPQQAAGEEEDGVVRIVDDYNQQKIAFIEPVVEAHSEADAISIDGLCARLNHGEAIQWHVDGTDLEGETACERGGFRFDLSEMQSLNCNQAYLMVAESDSGGIAQVDVMRKCAPLSEAALGPSSEGECFLELVKISDFLGSRCQQVCYRNSKVISSETVSGAECLSLQASN